MILPIYLIQNSLRNKEHNLNQAILMSPAGIHHKGRVTPYLHYIGLMFKNVLPKFVDHISVPDFTFDLVEKL